MNIFKSWFLGRLLREKVLVLAFILLGALIWLSSASDNLKASLGSYRSAQATLGTQALWLGNRGAIEDAASSAVRNLDPSKTFDATALVSAITGIAGRSQLPVNTEPPRTQKSSQFSVHTVQVTTRRAELAKLIRFYQELASRAPYLGLEQITFQVDRSAPGLVNVNMQVVSVELSADAATNTP